MFHIVHKHPKPLGSVPEPEQTEFQLPHAVQAVEEKRYQYKEKKQKIRYSLSISFFLYIFFLLFFQTNQTWLQYIFFKK